ncbi:MAG TPA: hypothetical protein VHB27_16385, partial [Rhodopila sp.]
MPISLLDLPTAFVRAVLYNLAMLMLQGAGGNMDEAWQAAVDLMRGHDVQTDVELHCFAQVIGFTLQSGEALGQAANP